MGEEPISHRYEMGVQMLEFRRNNIVMRVNGERLR